MDLAVPLRFEVARAQALVFERSELADVVLPDFSVARRRGRLDFTRDSCLAEDPGSHCGLYLNGASMREATAVQEGDLLLIGQLRYLVKQVSQE